MMQQVVAQLDADDVGTQLQSMQINEAVLAEIDSISDVAVLRQQVKNALEAVAEKERDLLLAAEIGQSLLLDNNDLRAKCEAFERAGVVVGLASPTTMLEEPEDAEDDADKQHRTAGADGGPTSPLTRSHSTLNSTQSTVARLEQQNAELSARVESLTAELKETKLAAKREAKRLLEEAALHKHQADTAETQCKNMTAQRDKLAKDKIELKGQVAKLEAAGALKHEHDHIDDLEAELNKSRAKVYALESTNDDLGKKLTAVAERADELEKRNDELERQAKEFSQMQESWKYQARHITELSEMVEEQRTRLNAFAQLLAEYQPGAHTMAARRLSRKTSVASLIDVHAATVAQSNLMTSQNALYHPSHMTQQQQQQQQQQRAADLGSNGSLIGELEAAWRRDNDNIQTGRSAFSSLMDSVRNYLLME
ncbi:hypothetical protein RI367_001240 [Sorochytrium milnesiophthora]